MADFSITDGGSIVILTAENEAARAWVEDNVSDEGYQPAYPNTLYIERNYVDALAEGITEAGLTITA